jgi:alpha-galactosidase
MQPESIRFTDSRGKEIALPWSVSRTKTGRAELLKIKVEVGKSAQPVRVEVKFKVPIAGIHGFWSPYRTCNLHNQTTLAWEHRAGTISGADYPAIAFTDRELGCRLFLGFTEHTAMCGWTLALSQADECYFAKFTYPDAGFLPAREWDKIEFYVEEGGGKVFDVLRRFSSYCEAHVPGALPRTSPSDWAYDPVFCTWYAVHAAVDRAWTEKTAREAAKMGFGQVIMDDGWQHDEYRRLGGDNVDTSEWFNRMGDWYPSSVKFPDFAGHVEYMHSLGLKYMLWWDPYSVGKLSKTAKTMRAYLRGRRFEGGRKMLCSQDESVRRHVVDTAVRLVRDYNLDGFKVDYLYSVDREPCENPGHEHFTPATGRAVYATMQEMYGCVKEIKPDFNVMHTGGPFWNAVSTAMRGIDVPFDVDGNIYFLAYIEAASGGLPLQSVPLLWSAKDGVEDIARHLISSAFFVPCVSVDLLTMPESHRALVQRWIDFYNSNKGFFRSCGRTFHNAGPLITGISADSGEKQITGIFRNTPVQVQNRQEILLLNGSSFSDVYITSEKAGTMNMEVFGPDFAPVGVKKIAVTDVAKLNIPAGGFAKLTR